MRSNPRLSPRQSAVRYLTRDLAPAVEWVAGSPTTPTTTPTDSGGPNLAKERSHLHNETI
jgi:hypothetical protein